MVLFKKMMPFSKIYVQAVNIIIIINSKLAFEYGCMYLQRILCYLNTLAGWFALNQHTENNTISLSIFLKDRLVFVVKIACKYCLYTEKMDIYLHLHTLILAHLKSWGRKEKKYIRTNTSQHTEFSFWFYL